MIRLSDLFYVEKPSTLIFSEQEVFSNGINFVSSSGNNNGIVARVKKIEGKKIYKDNYITVPLKGSVLQSFLQTENFYCAHQIAVLIPKINLSNEEMIYYTLVIRNNKYRYNYGRQADKTLKNLLIPSKDEIPNFVYNSKIPDYSDIKESLNKEKLSLNIKEWKYFEYGELFDLEKGKGPSSNFAQNNTGGTPFISATRENNGISYFVDYKTRHKGNTITIPSNGNSVGEAYYQEKEFCSTGDVNVLIPKFELNKYIAMFFITTVRKDKYRYNYGRKWGLEKMKTSKIKLPVDSSGKPDFEFMENYIKSLPYSKYL